MSRSPDDMLEFSAEGRCPTPRGESNPNENRAAPNLTLPAGMPGGTQMLHGCHGGPQLQETDDVLVVRDDLLAGGTKRRALPVLMKGAGEYVCASPVDGY